MSVIVFEFKSPGYPIANAREQAQLYCRVLNQKFETQNVEYRITNGLTIESGDEHRIGSRYTVDFEGNASRLDLTEFELSNQIVSSLKDSLEGVQIEREPTLEIDGRRYCPDFLVWDDDTLDGSNDGTNGGVSNSKSSSTEDWNFIRTIGFCFVASTYLVDRTFDEQGLQEAVRQVKERKWTIELLSAFLRTFIIVYGISEFSAN